MRSFPTLGGQGMRLVEEGKKKLKLERGVGKSSSFGGLVV